MIKCNKCGFCCTHVLCHVCTMVYGRPTKGYTKCPAFLGDKCHLATLPGQLGDAFRLELRVGKGCLANQDDKAKWLNQCK
jgi:hypothetical protein